MEPILISIGGAIGASSRYLVGQFLTHHSFPWATLTVNALGSFILGVVLFGLNSSDVSLLIGVGFCGAFTTFSSFSYQTVELWEQGDHRYALMNAVGNLFISLLAFGSALLLVG